MLKRIIPSLLLRGGRLVKGAAFADHRDAGSPSTTARVHDAQGADELILLDIDASREQRDPDFASFAAVARACFMPLTVGGGIRSVDTAHRCLAAGADKLCLTTSAHDAPRRIGELAHIFGAQAIVLGVDVVRTPAGRFLYDHRSHRPLEAPAWDEWLRRGVGEGAGEVRLLTVDREGRRTGLDTELLAEASERVDVPIILEGGAGTLDQVATAFRAGAEAIALGTMLVFSDNNIHKVKSFLRNAGLELRL
ncbi:MAG: nitronate monooxygenase [Deltaproteobacteria bacterium]|nr:nitronate monooxygenase [Deltaproteobacteria bacterium]